MAQFPVHPDQVTTEWLSGLLGHQVASVRWEPIGTGQVGDSVRFHLGCADDDCPETLAGKFPAEDAASRDTATRFGLYDKEVRFYRDVAPLLDMRVPEVLAAEVSEDGGEFVLLFEDLGPARQGDQIGGCDVEQARAAMRQAAAIHGPSWQNERAIGHDWLTVPPERAALVRALYPQAQTFFAERYRDALEPEYMALCEELASLAEGYFERDAEPQCVVHGDFRLDNMLFDVRGGAEPIAVLDWQTVRGGQSLTDIGYFMGCGIGENALATTRSGLAGICTVTRWRSAA